MPRLENWSAQKFGETLLVWGEIFDDEKGRFPDGYKIRTSQVLDLSPGWATTMNTLYELGEPESEWLDELMRFDEKLKDFYGKYKSSFERGEDGEWKLKST